MGLYFKAGSYVQASGSSATDGGRVAFYRLVATHPDQGLSITTASLAEARANQWYSQVLAYSGGVGGATWSIVNGVLPVGLTLSPAGVLSGVPLLVPSGTTYYFSVLVTDQQGDTTARNYALKVGSS